MIWVLDSHIDVLLFIVASLLIAYFIHRWILKSFPKSDGLTKSAWVLIFLMIVSGVVASKSSESAERSRLKNMIEGFAPTYAFELAEHGHERINANTFPDDNLYLSMIEAQKKWLTLNPSINDIYTFKKNADGKLYLCVDSETDYNRNGKYEGEREARTPIGELYESPTPNMLKAFEGQAAFDDIPYTDKWGTWVSEYVPMYDENRKVDAILGVDYDAKAWVSSILWHRHVAIFISFIFILLVLFGKASSVYYVAKMKEKAMMDEELRKTEEAVHFMTLNAPMLIWVAGPDQEIIYVNRYWQEFTGRVAKEDLGHGWKMAVHPDDLEMVNKIFKHAYEKKEDFKFEYRMKSANGEYRWLLARGTPRSREDGSFIGYIGTCMDMHEQKKLEAQLAQAQKMETVGTLAGGIAHDLNNQLTPLLGYIDIILKDTAENDPKKELLVEMEHATRRCAEVVGRLMNVARSSNQKKVWMSVPSMLADAKKLFPKILPSTIQVEISCEENIWPVLGNETELQTVLMNLAVNARDAMPKGGKLKIEASNKELDAKTIRRGFPEGKYVCVAMTDTGTGIAPENLQKIFEPFFTTKPKGQGTGLGMSMVFRVIKDHGGWVGVHSEVGKGTLVRFHLPADPTQVVSKNKQSSAQEALPKGSETILFVDDEEPIRNLGQMFLQRLGYKSYVAKDGAEAIEIYEKNKNEIAAVVMDMTMPKLPGREVLKSILKINPKAKVILASGFTSEATAKELIDEGAVDFLVKPYAIFALATALRKAIESKHE